MEKLKDKNKDKDKDKDTQQKSLEAWKEKQNDYDSALDSPIITEFNKIELIKSISFVYFAPALIVFCYLLLPLQEPIVGFVHNYVFLIQSTINVLSIVGVYVAWGYIYIGHVWMSPLILTVLMNTLVILICICTYFPLKGLAIIGAVCVFVSYRIFLPLLGKAAHLEGTPEFQRGVIAFAKLRLFFALAMFVSWAYLVLFFLYPELQLLYTFVYTTIMFTIKYTAILFTQKTTTKNFHGLAGFWMEFFHGIFGSIAFPQISEWYVILFILLVQVATTGMLWVAFTDWWWRLSRWFLTSKSQRNPRKVSLSPPPSLPDLLRHSSILQTKLTRDNKRGSQESLVPHKTENIDNNHTTHDFIPINTSVEIPNPHIAPQTQRPSFTKIQSLTTQTTQIIEPQHETLLQRISSTKNNQNLSQENLAASISQALESQLQKANFAFSQKSQSLSSEPDNALLQRNISTKNQSSLLSTSSDSLLTNNSPEIIPPPTPLPLSLNLPPTNNSINTSSSNIPLSLSSDIALQVPSNPNFDFTQTREDFTQSMIKVTVLSIFSHTLVPLYFFPLSFFIRYSYNKIYFPYHLLSQSSFNSSLILSSLSFSIAIMSMIVLNIFLKRRCAVSLWSILFPLLLQHKYYFALAVLSGVSGSVVSILYHYQLYYAFNK